MKNNNFLSGWTTKYPKLYLLFFFISGFSMTCLFSLGGFAKPVYVPVLIIVYITTYIFLIRKELHLKIISSVSNRDLWLSLIMTAVMLIKYHKIISTFIEDIFVITKYSEIVAQHLILQQIYNYIGVLSAILCILSFFAVWLFLAGIISGLKPFFTDIFTKFDKTDKYCLIVSFLLFVPFIFILYTHTNAFYAAAINDTYFKIDIFYSTDTPQQFFENVWLSIGASENDFKQPLFGLAALPSSIPSAAMSYIFPVLGVKTTYAAWLCITQFMMLIFSLLLLAKMIQLNSTEKILFILFTCATYGIMFFSINLEQYIIPVFWLILFFYFILEKKKNIGWAGIIATGSIVTSVVALPLLLVHEEYRSPRKWMRLAVSFLIVVILCGKLLTVFNTPQQFIWRTKDIGIEKTFYNKFAAYTDFVYSCFFTPDHKMIILDEPAIMESTSLPFPTEPESQYMYVQNSSVKLNIYGSVILLLSVLCAVLNRKNKPAQILAYWIFFSFFLLAIVGWGLGENIQFLYTIYFSWAFIALIFLSIVRLLEKVPAIKYSVIILIILLLAINNIPVIKEIIDFSLIYYPQ